MVELYDKNNTEHNDRNIYEVVEWGEVVDSRHPDSVEVGTLEEDKNRRDFTTGNIYWSPRELIISVQSVDDILDRKLRFVGKAKELAIINNIDVDSSLISISHDGKYSIAQVILTKT